MKIISSLKNDFIKDLKKQKEKNKFLFFLDNPKLIEEAITSGFNVDYLLIDIEKKDKFLIFEEKYLEKVIYVDEKIIKSFSEVISPQGIIGVLERNVPEKENFKGAFLVLDNVQDAGNVGTLLRSALGANFNNVFLLDSARLTNDKTIRSSMGAIFKLNIFEMTKNDFLKFAREKKLVLYSADMKGENLFSFEFENNSGIIVGNEGNGVSDELIEISKNVVSIPMNEKLESLNVGVAGSIIMFDYQRKLGGN